MNLAKGQKYLIIMASFIIMLCLGGIYAWSIIASELTHNGLSVTQSQMIFGLLIAVFPVTMIFTGQLAKKIRARYFGYLSGALFFAGYFLGARSEGDFIPTLFGLGILPGIATGFGYWMSLTIPVQWFPEKKGLITGIAAAGFGLGAVVLSRIAEIFLSDGKNVFELIQFIGILYGFTILIFSNFIIEKIKDKDVINIKNKEFISSGKFIKLLTGIFLGTFAGLMIIGSLKMIGEQSQVKDHTLVLGVSLFAVANFSGRLFWGFLSDYLSASLNIFIALAVQATGIFLLNVIPLSGITFLLFSVLIGFGFGSNFVLFAKETAHIFGVSNLGIVYPYVFLGYATAGIAGPSIGGLLYDIFGNFTYSIFLASLMSLSGSLLFLYNFMKLEQNDSTG